METGCALKPVVLRDYQHATVRGAHELLRAGHRRVLVVGPCGIAQPSFMPRRHSTNANEFSRRWPLATFACSCGFDLPCLACGIDGMTS
jgi:hypothetical protein